ncbi:hypothetical protein A3C37_01755 [Candidatus Peribacteria bacterium RIFCSPHIGHO2_02_FULL_53_20]|nr:MAG: hypothetical protein A3C37_01755 [Candidatus Peribacteria bacterium RIFCSPHIGHO2_02_FULL_53_20]OGJ69995.1 MAG: hypothetical protein A3G69_05175 [Candidatus Peribacteria bacterium RIFCSPLOWO2_12_FULL_53_10]
MHRVASPGRSAFLLVEALLGVAIFAITAVAAYGILLQGQEASIGGGNRVRATLLSERALEAARSMRDASWASLTAGVHGVAVGSDGLWTFSGSQMTVDQFTTQLTVTPLASDRVGLSAQTTWNHGVKGSGSVMLSAELTDWRKSIGGNWTSISLQGSYVDSDSPLFNDVSIKGNYAFVTCENDDDCDGLYVFDLANLAAPSRVASSFDLGVYGYDLVVNGNVLYVATSDNNGEIRAYAVHNPASLSSAKLITSYNLPGSGRARSLALKGSTLYVGATESNSASRDEFYTFDVTNTGSIVLRDSLDDSGSIYDISIRGTTAYLASTADTSEIRVVNVADPANISFLGGYNLTDVHNGLSLHAFGSGTLVGRTGGSAIDELVRFSWSSGVPSAPPGPWYRELGGNAEAMVMENSECAVFIATTNSTKELQVVNGRNISLAEFTSYNTTTGDGRGITYDVTLDRVFMTTNKALLIFQPATGAWTCP